MKENEYRFLMRIFVLISFLSVMIIAFPFLDTIAFACAFAYMTEPFFSALKKYTGRTLGAILCILMITVPAIILVFLILTDIFEFLNSLDYAGFVDYTVQFINYIGLQNIAKEDLSSILSEIWNFLKPTVNKMAGQIYGLPLLFIKGLVTVFLTYYFLKDGYRFKDAVMPHVPEVYHVQTELFIRKLHEAYKNLFVVNALTAFTVGLISIAGFWAIGLPNPVTLGALSGILTLLPIVGGWTIYLPLSVYYIAVGMYSKAILLFGFGVLFLSLAPDFVIRPRLVNHESSIHPAFALVAFLMGPLALGITGFALGPLIMGTFDAIFRVKNGKDSIINLK
ncbi:putative PurR-regulated permease PerM [Methanococcus maripaludis]|uniref:Putative PurR-regulated permease PerM n=1 Tax=Methanococcus maripaludis TaxID=39152 RepID=A0A7J9NTN0_METMI|nr:AI-2E family transporter [Methanococcus maripaludis]MBA2846831.1 putative PurR-regulated permease PerM [Methanococcus maripaludis]